MRLNKETKCWVIMKKLSFNPDPDMRWIYDILDERFNSPQAESLRARRRNAIQNAPKWMLKEAAMNDLKNLGDKEGEVKTEITKDEYLQLVGLLTLAKINNQKQEDIYKAILEITLESGKIPAE